MKVEEFKTHNILVTLDKADIEKMLRAQLAGTLPADGELVLRAELSSAGGAYTHHSLNDFDRLVISCSRFG